MTTNNAYTAQELPEEEMKMLYSLLGKKPPKATTPQPRFRFNFRFMRKTVESENH